MKILYAYIPFMWLAAIPFTAFENYGNAFIQMRGEEFMIDTTCAYDTIPQAGTQTLPAIAHDGTNYLVVWLDNRNSVYNIYGSRVDSCGKTLDPGGIAINTVNRAIDFVPLSVAFDGTNFFVVWLNEYMSAIYGMRIDQSGYLVDTAAIIIATDTVHGFDSPHVAFGDSNYLVVWNSWAYPARVYGVRIDPSGTILDTSWIVVSGAAEEAAYPAVTFNGVNYFVVWQGLNAKVFGARVTQDGIVLDPEAIIISQEPNAMWYFSVASDNSDILVVWASGGTESDIYGARVDQSGTVLDTAGIAISSASNRQDDPRIVFNGDHYFVTWSDQRNGAGNNDIYGARMTQSGIVLDSLGIPISILSGTTERLPAIAGNGSEYFAVWEESWSDIYGKRIDQSGVVLDTAGICVSVGMDYYQQMYPDIAFDGTNYFAVWEDYRGGPKPDIYGARVDQTGTPIDVPPIMISAETDSQGRPSVCFGGSSYFVVWEDERNDPGQPYNEDIYGARVSNTGVVIDTHGIPISTIDGWEIHPDVAFDGTNYFAVWQDLRNSGPYYDADIYGARITTSGIVLDTFGIPIAKATGYQEHPSVIFGGSNYLVTWDDTRGSGINIRCARVDQAGYVLDTTGIIVTSDSSSQQYPSVSFDGVNYLIVWQDMRSGNYQDDIYCTRVDQSGVVLDTASLLICNAPGLQGCPSVCFDNSNYLIAWHDRRSTNNYNIYAAAVNPAGIIVDSFLITFQPPYDRTFPTLIHGINDQIFAAYQGWTDTINNHPINMMRVWGRLSPFPGIEENSAGIVQSSKKSLQAYPNPAKKQCNLTYIIHKATHVLITVYDVPGRLVKEIVNYDQYEGHYRLQVDMSHFAQGVYFIKICTDYSTETEKIILID